MRTALKRQFCKWKDVGAVVPILYELADLVVAQGGGGIVILGGATAQDTFDDGVGHGHSVGHG